MLTALLLLLQVQIHAQKPFSWDELVEYIAQNEDDFEEERWTEHLEELEQLTLSPININTASREDLLSLPFLSEKQVDDIRDYVARYYGMKTLFELQLIPSITYFDRQVLPLFVFCEQPSNTQAKNMTFKEMMKKHQHEILSRVDIPFYHRKGYLVENGYSGRRIYNKNIYSFSATKHIQASIHTERDAGERGIDSHGGQIILKDIGHLSTLVLGDYRVGFGEGLVINQGFSMGKASPLSNPSQGLRAIRSTDEYNFMRGAGTSLRFQNWTFSTFFSIQKMDATLNNDGSIKTIQSSGYHRTQLEKEKENTFTRNVVGANVGWQHKSWHAGLTSYFLRTSKPLVPGKEYYRQIYPKGKQFANASVNYGYSGYNWTAKGETAYDFSQHGLATLNTISYRINNRYRLTASGRYYDKHYYSTFASAIKENTNVQNEIAATIRLDAKPIDGLTTEIYADLFYNTWPRYLINHSSSGQEIVATTLYTINRKNSFNIRYSFKNKEYSNGIQRHNRVRINWIYESGKWKFQTTSFFHAMRGSYGEAIGETVRFGQGTLSPVRFSMSALYFHTDDYNSRISLYETNVAGSLSMPSFSGHGTRLSGTIQYLFWHERMRLELKYGLTWFFDRKIQGSDLQTIYSPYKNDLTLQLRFKI